MPSISYSAVLPELLLVALFTIVLVVDLVLGEKNKALTPITLIGLLATFVVICSTHRGATATANSTYVSDAFSQTAKGVLVGTTLLVVLFGARDKWRGEYLLMIISALCGMSLLVSARDLILFFVAFELVAIPTYVLVAWQKTSKQSTEAAFKYYVVGVVTTAIMAYGFSFLFGIAGSTRFSEIASAVTSGQGAALARVGAVLVVAGIAFKIAAVPFHFWAPDVYREAPVSVVAFLAISSKGAGLVAMIVVAGLLPDSDVIQPMLFALAIATMTVGNLVALRQTNFMRLMAWSSIAQSGFLLVPIAVSNSYGAPIADAAKSTLEYFVVYAIATAAALGVATVAFNGRDTAIANLGGLFWRSPRLAAAMAIAMVSLAGIPPFGGWFAKFVILDEAVGSGSTQGYVMAGFVSVNTAISLAFYALVVRQMWLQRPLKTAEEHSVGATAMQEVSIGIRALLVLAPILMVVTGILPGLITSIGSTSFLGL